MQRSNEPSLEAFIAWFEKKCPGKAYVVEDKDEGGVMLVCDDGTVVAYADYFADMLGLHEDANAIIKAHDRAYPETDQETEEEAEAHTSEG